MNRYYACLLHPAHFDENRLATILWTEDDERAEWHEMVAHVELDWAWKIVEALTFHEECRRQKRDAELEEIRKELKR